MSKRRLPPATPGNRPLRGPNLSGYTVGSWCPTPDGSGPPQAVAIALHLENGPDLVFRLKSPRAVDELIQMLLRHKREVWPEAP